MPSHTAPVKTARGSWYASKPRAAAAAAGDVVVAEFEDQAKTGTEMTRRPAYQEVLRLAQAGLIDTVRIESVSRANRNELDRRLMERDLRAFGVEVIYLGEREDMAEHERLVYRGIQGVLSEDESVKLSQRVYKRTRYRAEQGKWRGGKIPFGLVPNTNAWFDPDPETYPFLLWILERRAERWGHQRIAGALNRGVSIEGAAPVKPDSPLMREYRRRPNIEHIDKETGDIFLEAKPVPTNMWTANTIRNICHAAVDGVYAGVFRWGEKYERWSKDDQGKPKAPVRFEHEPLVPKELCERVAAVEAAAKGRKRGGKPSAAFLLRPTCGVCGGPMHSHWVERESGGKLYSYRYYYCSRSRNRGLSDAEIQTELDSAQRRIQQEFIDGITSLRSEVAEAVLLHDDLLDTFSNLGDVSVALQRALLDRADRGARRVEGLEGELRAVEHGFRQFCARVTATKLDLAALNLERWETNEERFALKRVLALLLDSVTLYPPEQEPVPGRGRRKARVVTKVKGPEELLGD